MPDLRKLSGLFLSVIKWLLLPFPLGNALICVFILSVFAARVIAAAMCGGGILVICCAVAFCEAARERVDQWDEMLSRFS